MPDDITPQEIGPGAEPDTERSGFDSAVDLFKKEQEDVPVVPPKLVVEGEKVEAKTTTEPEPVKEPDAEFEKPPEFVKFDKPEQQQRFNKMFGYAKRLERELQQLREQTVHPIQAPAYQPPHAYQAPTNGHFGDPAPKLKDFDDPDIWAAANADWTVKKARHEARQETEQLLARQFESREQQRVQSAQQEYENRKIANGYQKYGTIDFDDASNDLATVVTQPMRSTLFQLDHFEDVVVHLGRNLQEAERIARLPFLDQAYELKSLDRRLNAKTELAQKKEQPKPTKVEQPGQGEPDGRTNLGQRMRIAKESGDLKDWAKVIQEMPNT